MAANGPEWLFKKPQLLPSRTNQQIQTKAMALLMALLQTAGDSDRQVPPLRVSHFQFNQLPLPSPFISSVGDVSVCRLFLPFLNCSFL